MSTSESITDWIANLKHGKDETVAQQRIWDRYFYRLAGLARTRLRGSRRQVADEEDVVLSALNSFFEGIPHGEFPKLTDRESLWPLLAKITIRKAINQRKYLDAQKRYPVEGAVYGESMFLDMAGDLDLKGLDQWIAKELTPELADDIFGSAIDLIDALPDESLRTVARMLLQGYSTTEIAAELHCVKRTVERKRSIIQEEWKRQQLLGDE